MVLSRRFLSRSSRLAFVLSGLAVAVSLVVHVPGRLRPRGWRAPQVLAVKTASPVGSGTVIAAAPGRPAAVSRQRKSARGPRRARFTVAPRPDFYKAVRPPMASLPVLISALAEEPLTPVTRPLLGAWCVRVLAEPADGVARRLIRPG